MMQERNTRGFTLIELMIVVIIIAALAGMIVPRLMPASTSAKSKIARGEIANIELALNLFRLHLDRYPTTAEGLSILLQAPSSGDWKEPFLDEASDPWGRPYHYTYPGVHNPTKFDIWSDGPETGAADDDITNWAGAESQS